MIMLSPVRLNLFLAVLSGFSSALLFITGVVKREVNGLGIILPLTLCWVVILEYPRRYLVNIDLHQSKKYFFMIEDRITLSF